MKKLAFLLLAICLLCGSVPAYADMIFVPESDFATRHRGELVTLRRQFYVRSPAGAVTVMEAPDQDTVRGTVENETLLTVYSTWQRDGVTWGLIELEPPAIADLAPGEPAPEPSQYSGWLPMEHLVLKYDTISFDEEHSAEYTPYTGDFDSDLPFGMRVISWTYPGSGEREGWFVVSDGFYATTSVISVWTAPDGSRWGLLNGRGISWVCLNDPTNENLRPFNNNPATGLWQPPARNGGISLYLLAILLVAALAAGTAILIRVVWKPGRKAE